jgi:hypothetical protein
MASMCLIMLSIVFDRHISGYHMAVVAGVVVSVLLARDLGLFSDARSGRMVTSRSRTLSELRCHHHVGHGTMEQSHG